MAKINGANYGFNQKIPNKSSFSIQSDAEGKSIAPRKIEGGDLRTKRSGGN